MLVLHDWGGMIGMVYPTLIASPSLRPTAYAIDATMQELAAAIGRPSVGAAYREKLRDAVPPALRSVPVPKIAQNVHSPFKLRKQLAVKEPDAPLPVAPAGSALERAAAQSSNASPSAQSPAQGSQSPTQGSPTPPGAPSLGDLGLTPADTEGSAARQAMETAIIQAAAARSAALTALGTRPEKFSSRTSH